MDGVGRSLEGRRFSRYVTKNTLGGEKAERAGQRENGAGEVASREAGYEPRKKS